MMSMLLMVIMMMVMAIIMMNDDDDDEDLSLPIFLMVSTDCMRPPSSLTCVSDCVFGFGRFVFGSCGCVFGFDDYIYLGHYFVMPAHCICIV